MTGARPDSVVVREEQGEGLHVIRQPAGIHGAHPLHHGPELIAEVVVHVAGLGPGRVCRVWARAEQAVRLGSQRIKSRPLILGDAGEVHGLIRIRLPELGHEAAVVRMAGPPRPVLGQDRRLMGRGPAGVRWRWISEPPPCSRAPGVGPGLVGLERQRQVHVKAVFEELANQLPERIIPPGGNLPIPSRLPRNRAVHAVLIVEGHGNENPVGVQLPEPGDVIRRNERAGAPRVFPSFHNRPVRAPIPGNRDGAKRELEDVNSGTRLRFRIRRRRGCGWVRGRGRRRGSGISAGHRETGQQE